MKLNSLKITLGTGLCLLFAACTQNGTNPSTAGTGQAVSEVIVQRENTPLHGAYTRVNGACRYAVSQPVTFHNSGRRAVTVNQFAPVFGLKPVNITGENSRELNHAVQPQIFLTTEFSVNQLGLTAAQLMQQRTLVPSYERVGDLIEAGETYTLYVNVLIDVMPELRNASDITAAINIGTVFDNHQVLTIEKNIRYIKDILEDCR